MRHNLEKSLELMLAHEGGFSDHPEDPGGATNLGVTQRVYDAYRSARKQHLRSVKEITSEEVDAIYRKQYWDAVRGDELPNGLDYAVFDFAVNSGPARAALELQKLLNVAADGIIGLKTLAAIGEISQYEIEDLITDYCLARLEFVKRLKTFKTFGRGWTRRIMGSEPGAQRDDHGVIDYATEMAYANAFNYVEQRNLPLPRPVGALSGEVAGQARDSDVAVVKTKEGVGATSAAIGAVATALKESAEQLGAFADGTILGQAVSVVAMLLMVGGSGLMAWSFYRKIDEQSAKL